jgi:hypothetical protein
MNPTFDSHSRLNDLRTWPLLLMSVIFINGCTAANDTHLALRGGPKGPAEYQFREMLWRPSRDAGGGVEIIGYGLIPFLNDPSSRDWDPRYPRSGFVTLRIHATPQAQGGYAITILGPSMSLGPGDDEILSAVAENAQLETGDGDKRILHITDAPTQSRNHPNVKYFLSGAIIATPSSNDNFERQLRQFNLEQSYRGPTTKQ